MSDFQLESSSILGSWDGFLHIFQEFRYRLQRILGICVVKRVYAAVFHLLARMLVPSRTIGEGSRQEKQPLARNAS
jgi:hypothetical protein